MIKVFLCMAFLASAAPAVADELQPPHAPAGSAGCYPLTDLLAFLDRAGGRLIQLKPTQFQFARGVYVATPPVSTALPPGDRGALAVVDNRNELFFLDGDVACDAGALPSPLWRMLLEIADGKITHLGDGT
jgi:hypothetical protein